MKISKIYYYGGSQEKVCRLGLSHLFFEVQEIIFSTYVDILKEKQKNSAGVVRERLDKSFDLVNQRIKNIEDKWVKSTSGDIDWVRRFKFNSSIVPLIGVEIQVSGRSDMLARDIVHLRNSLHESKIDIGVIIVPSDEFEYFLTDRVANISYARKYVEKELYEASSYPIILIAIEHDGFSDTPLPKKSTNRGKFK